jgi:hypothetical protein
VAGQSPEPPCPAQCRAGGASRGQRHYPSRNYQIRLTTADLPAPPQLHKGALRTGTMEFLQLPRSEQGEHLASAIFAWSGEDPYAVHARFVPALVHQGDVWLAGEMTGHPGHETHDPGGAAAASAAEDHDWG